MTEDGSSSEGNERFMGSSTRSASVASSVHWSPSLASSTTAATRGHHGPLTDQSVHCSWGGSSNRSQSISSVQSQGQSAMSTTGSVVSRDRISSFTQTEVSNCEAAVLTGSEQSSCRRGRSRRKGVSESRERIANGRHTPEDQTSSRLPSASAQSTKETEAAAAVLEAEIEKLRGEERRLTQEMRALWEQNVALRGQVDSMGTDMAGEPPPRPRRSSRLRVKESREHADSPPHHRKRKKGVPVAGNPIVLIAVCIATLLIVPTCSWLGASAGTLIGQGLPI